MRLNIRKYFLSVLSVSAAAVFLGGTTIVAAQAPEGTGGIMTPGPDIEAAVRSEYQRIESQGTREAYELFIQRHPDHALADDARKKLEKGGLK